MLQVVSDEQALGVRLELRELQQAARREPQRDLFDASGAQETTDPARPDSGYESDVSSGEESGGDPPQPAAGARGQAGDTDAGNPRRGPSAMAQRPTARRPPADRGGVDLRHLVRPAGHGDEDASASEDDAVPELTDDFLAPDSSLRVLARTKNASTPIRVSAGDSVIVTIPLNRNRSERVLYRVITAQNIVEGLGRSKVVHRAVLLLERDTVVLGAGRRMPNLL